LYHKDEIIAKQNKNKISNICLSDKIKNESRIVPLATEKQHKLAKETAKYELTEMQGFRLLVNQPLVYLTI